MILAKSFIVTFAICFLSLWSSAQATNLVDRKMLKNTKFIKLYTISRSSKDCEDLKQVQLIDSGRIN
jgi:hypothetical protein